MVTYAVGQDEYMDFVQAAGVRVIIHDQDETVLPDVSGINVPTGFQATATIRRVADQGRQPIFGESASS